MAETEQSTLVDWTQDLTLQLIGHFREQEHLWDLKHPEYTNRELRKNTWAAIGAKLNISRSEIERKCHALRLQFYRERRKQLISEKYGMECDDTYTSDWKYYKDMQFLSDYYEPINVSVLLILISFSSSKYLYRLIDRILSKAELLLRKEY